MRIQTRLVLILLAVAVVPVAISGVTAVTLSRRVLDQHIKKTHVAEARYLAEHIDAYVGDALRQLRLVADITPFADLGGDELQGALGLVYRLHDGFDIVGLVDDQGQGVGQPVRAVDPDNEPSAQGHFGVSVTELGRFANQVPLQAALSAGAAIGPPYVSPEKGIPLLVLAVRVGAAEGRAPMVLAVELALESIHRRVNETAAQDKASVFVVDSRGRVVTHSLSELALSRADLSSRAPVQAIASDGLDGLGMVRYRAGDTHLAAAFARLGRLPWGVVVELPERIAFAPVTQIARQTGFWIVVALLCAIAAGLVLARSIGDPIRALDRAAAALKQGDLSRRARVSGRDEIARLATSFNEMASAIAQRDEELRAFTDELQERVEQRTRELRKAQEQLLQSEKLAAVGELGAGVAHEINNPLAGVLGEAQLLLLRSKDDDPQREHLQNIEAEALRIRDIVHNLLQLSQSAESKAGTLVDVNRVMEAALNLLARPIIAQRIQVQKKLAAQIPKIRADPAELQQVFMHLLSNAKNAMPQGGTLTICSEVVDNRLVRVRVIDDGIGIRDGDKDKIFEPFYTRKEDWEGKGLGLSVAHRLIEQLGGNITVESQRGQGAEFVLVFPVVRGNLHLS